MSSLPLADRFLAARPGSAPVEALETRLTEAIVAVRRAWAEIAPEDETIVDDLAAQLPIDDADALSRVCVPDLWIARACRRGDDAALSAFVARYRPLMDSAFGRVAAEGIDPEDLQQRFLQRLFVGERPAIDGYEGRGALTTWLKVAANRLRIDAQRRRGDKVARLPTGARDDDADDIADPELALVQDQYREAYKAAFRAAFEALDARDRNLLRYSVIDGLTATQIASLYNVHRATAKRWLASIREGLLARARADLARVLGSHAVEEVDAMLAMAASRLDLTITRHLRTPA